MTVDASNTAPSSPRPLVLSLYSGAGGMDLGFFRAGFRLGWANEIDKHACETYRRNLGGHVVEGDLLDATIPDMPFDVVIGGPPCQGWSRIGRMDPEDPRSEHVHRFLDVVENVQPRAFVMENVAHLAESPRWAQVRGELLERARSELGFEAQILVLDASHFSVPQARRRMFLIGIRGKPLRGMRTTSRRHPPTAGRALRRLPELGAKGNATLCTAKVVPARRAVLRPSPYMGSLLFNGSGRPLDLDAPARTLPGAMGGNATPIVDQLELEGQDSPWVDEYHRRLLDGQAPLTNAPTRMRRLTVEEAAALQSFPPTFNFCGPVAARYRQIGNAVPPALARAVARGLLRTL